jgi:serine-type D-Ala-D-Ala carboxypeptidase/endopeptidase (penicillin-binding protein 4)
MTKRFFVAFFSTLFFAHMVWAKNSVEKKYVELVSDNLVNNAQWSFSAKYVDSDDYIISHNYFKSLNPASGLKAITTAVALENLGEDYVFKTKLYHSGNISNGALNGNVYIVGSGDPTLGSGKVEGSYTLDELMSLWVKLIKVKGIKTIEGSIVADDSIFSGTSIPGTWYWLNIGNYYGAGANALTIHDNTYTICFKPGKNEGDRAKVLYTTPKIEGLDFRNFMTTGDVGSGDRGYIYNAPGSFYAKLRGSVPGGRDKYCIKGSIPDPALFAAQTFGKALIKSGIKVSGVAKKIQKAIKYSQDKFIGEVESPKLSKIIYYTNKRSDNLYAEQILRALGYAKKGSGSITNGLRVVKEFFKNNDIDISGVRIFDGSGLSRPNTITTKMMVTFLSKLTKKDYFDTFYDSLVVTGDPHDLGSYKRFGEGTEIEKNVHMKTGSLLGVKSFSGYVKDKRGRLIAFSVISNNYTGSSYKITNICKQLMIELAKLD